MQLRWIRMRASLTLFWERFWRAFWVLFSFMGVVLALFLSDALPTLHWSLHLIALALIAGTGIWLLIRALKAFDRTTDYQRDRRIERDSQLVHRPLTSLGDTNAVDDQSASALWRLHEHKSQRALKTLTVKAPSPGVPARDLNALRIIPLLLLIVFLPLGWADAWPRVSRAVSPELPKSPPPTPVTIDAWVSPPTYTGMRPFVLPVEDQTDSLQFEAPVGSEFLLQYQGGEETPSLWRDDQRLDLTIKSQGTFRFEKDLTEPLSLSLVRGEKKVSQDHRKHVLNLEAKIQDDLKPQINHQEDPRSTDAGSLRLNLKGEDDYGFRRITLHLGIEGKVSALAALYQNLDVGFSGSSPKTLDFTEFLDLADHPFAGQEVSIDLTAFDHAGQSGTTATKTLRLPAYNFENAISRQLAKSRSQLFKRPERAGGVAAALEVMAEHPDLEAEKFAGVRDRLSAMARTLQNSTYGQTKQVASAAPETEIQTDAIDPELQALDSVARELWDLARRLDDNPIRRAEEKLRKLEEQLREALERGASDEELAALMDQLREAMEEYKQAVIAEKLAEMLEKGELNLNQGQRQPDAMQDLAERLEDMTRKGAREEALSLLDELKEMMENLRNAELELNLDGQSGESSPSQGQRMLDDLNQLMQQQQELLNDSFRKQQQGVPTNPQSGQRSAQQQEQLRRDLGQGMRDFSQMLGGEIPQGLADAERAMKDATRGLENQDRQGAIEGQTRALNEMQRSAQSLADMMRQRAEQQGQQGQGQQGQGREGEGQQGQGQEGQGQEGTQQGQNGQGQGENGQQGFANGETTDPLGRAYGEGAPVDLSPEASKKIARGIRDELRRRAGEPDRSTLERSYIEDLLEEF